MRSVGKTISEEFISDINTNIFLREFTFSENEFSPAPGGEVQFADNVVWIDDLMFIYQIKERHEQGKLSEETERKWFDKKVLGMATKQIRDTLDYLENNDNIIITNQRGHDFHVDNNKIVDVIKIIVPVPSKVLPQDCWNKKFHISSRAGFIHIIPIHDYLGICRTFITPAEIREYLLFREKISIAYEEAVRNVLEPALVGQFLYGDFGEMPNSKYGIYQETLLRNTDEFTIMFILEKLGDHIDIAASGGGETDYYKLLIEFAKLVGIELRAIKQRISLSLQACEKNEFQFPYRIVAPKTGCGFIFLPLQKEHIINRHNALQNFTYLAKYDQRIDRCIGVSFAKDEHDFLIDWMFLEFPWEQDSVLEKILKTSYPFRKLKTERLHRYYFDKDKISGIT
jgi:hypothetical protein